MPDKPKQWREAYASIFQDASVVAAYAHRPPYPAETFEILLGLIPAALTPRRVLDAGCGTGFIARRLAASVDWIDAVDISARMISMAQSLPGGDQANIRWMAQAIETAPLHGPYALMVAAASLHWMDWERTLPRFAAHLHPQGVLALVEEHGQPNAWDSEIGPILGRYSLNRDFSPYDMTIIAADLAQRQLFRLLGSQVTQPVLFEQPLEAWIESFHARNGFSRDRMDAGAAHAFGVEMRQAMLPHCPDGVVRRQIAARILWGTPLASGQR